MTMPTGRPIGRPHKLTDEQQAEAARRYWLWYRNQPKVIASDFGVDTDTIRKTALRRKAKWR